MLDFYNIYVIILNSTSQFFSAEEGIELKDDTIYVLSDGREFHIEDLARPAVLMNLASQTFWMGNSTGVVIGLPVVIPDPEQCPEMIVETSGGISRFLPEDQWPRLNAEMPLVRGLAGTVDYSKEMMAQYMNRLHVLGIAVRN